MYNPSFLSLPPCLPVCSLNVVWASALCTVLTKVSEQKCNMTLPDRSAIITMCTSARAPWVSASGSKSSILALPQLDPLHSIPRPNQTPAENRCHKILQNHFKILTFSLTPLDSLTINLQSSQNRNAIFSTNKAAQ